MTITTHEHLKREADSPALNAFSITPSDNDLGWATRAVYVGGAGDLKVVMTGGGPAVTYVAVPAGTVLPISVTQVNSIAGGATNIVGMY